MPVLCVGEVHFSSIERMQIRELFSIGQFFLKERHSFWYHEHVNLLGCVERASYSCRRADDRPLADDNLQLGHDFYPLSENSQFHPLLFVGVSLTLVGRFSSYSLLLSVFMGLETECSAPLGHEYIEP